MKRKMIFLAALVYAVVIKGYSIEQPTSQEQKYSVLMLSFLKGIVWPKPFSNTNIVIGVYEYDPLFIELQQAAKTMDVGGKKVTVKALTSVDDCSACHMIFLPAFKAKKLPEFISKSGDQPVIFITNKPGMAQQGSGINFILIGGQLRYEINSKAIESRGIKVSSVIKGRGVLIE